MTTCCAGPIVADCAADTASVARHDLLNELQSSARTLSDGSVNYALSVPAIHCGNCISTIEDGLKTLAGVTSVRANLSLRRVSLTLDNPSRSPLSAIEALQGLGYKTYAVTDTGEGQADAEFKALLRALAVAGFAAANIMLLSVSVWTGAEGATRELFHLISALIAIPAVAYAGMPFFRSAVAALASRRMNMDVPISLGVLLATGMSLYESFLGGGHAYFDAATSLLFFLLIGRTLDQLMRSKARAAAGRLARLSAKGGFVVGKGGSLTYMALDAIAPDMVLRVAAGERFPVDAIVVDGRSDVDRALVTGESEPQRLEAGCGVEAGTLNLTGPVDVRATRTANESFLAEVTAMMTAAERGRSNYVRIADRMARIYSPAVHVLALTTFVGWMIWTGGDWHHSLTVAVSVLIITCPCALGLAVPVAHVISAGRLFSGGVIMKDGSALERMVNINGAVFDKTGTLTTGEPTVTSTEIPSGKLAAIAKSMALRSVHPAARALARHLAEPPAINLADMHEVPGHGVEATINGQVARLGRADWVSAISSEALGVPVHSGVAFALAGGDVMMSSLSEKLRAGAWSVVENFTSMGVPVTLLSGDGEAPVFAVARQLGITAVQSGLKPGEKLAFLEAGAQRGERLLMVGDGLNDAPALAAAHVSMAPASASDIGRMAADFVFTRDSLTAVSYAHRVAVATGRIVRENFGLAILYNLFAVPMAMAGMLNPLIAAIAMSTSSIIVVGNSLRLQLLKPLPEEQQARRPERAKPRLVPA